MFINRIPSFYYGFINISTVNLSFNEVTNSHSAFYCYPKQINSDDIGTSITYSSFADNTASSQYCIYLDYADYSAKYYSVNNSNIIRNKGDITIYSRGTTSISECCIRDNTGTNYYFYSVSGSITLDHCSIDSNTNTCSGGTLAGDTTPNKYTFINSLSLFENISCEESFDFIEFPQDQKTFCETPYIHLLLIHRWAFFMTFLYS